MQTCSPQLNDQKVIDGVTLHFVSVDAIVAEDQETIVVEGLALTSDAPEFVVVQAFLQTTAGQSAAAVVATTVVATSATTVTFVAARIPPKDAGAEALSLRFDLLIRE